MPYAATALEDWLGGPVDQYCSETNGPRDGDAGLRACPRAFRRRSAHAVRHRRDGQPGHESPEARAASDSCRLAIGDDDGGCDVQLHKGRRTRAEEEQVATQLILARRRGGVRRGSASQSIETVAASRRRAHAMQQAARLRWTELLLGQRERAYRMRANATQKRTPADPVSRRVQSAALGTRTNGRDRGRNAAASP